MKTGVHVHHLQTCFLPFLADPLLLGQVGLIADLCPYGGRVDLRADPGSPYYGTPAGASANDRASKPGDA